MSSGVTYAIANEEDDDALLTFAEAGSAKPVGTSAATDLDDDVEIDGFGPSFESKSNAPSRRCLWVIIPVVAIALIATVAGLFKGKSHAPVKDQKGGAPLTQQAGSPILNAPIGSVPTYGLRVKAHYPHDRAAFTQGFEYKNGYFYESTGLRGHSSLRKVNILDGNVEQKYEFKDKNLFGEGITLHKDHHIFMLTWRAGRGFIFDQKNLTLIREWRYKGQGWGLAMDDEKDEVYMSDGTAQLRVLEPEQMSFKRWVDVTLDGVPVKYINELEWVCGELWANIWQKKLIYRIDPVTGNVKSVIDANKLPLHNDITKDQNVLNGIAFDKHTPRIYLTGKKWSKVYEVEILDPHLNITCAIPKA